MRSEISAGRLFKMPKPPLAALPGPAAGAGLSLALACDMRIMASTAIMTTAFARVGFSGDDGGTYFMTQRVGIEGLGLFSAPGVPSPALSVFNAIAEGRVLT